MSVQFKYYKRVFRKNLQPIFAVLVAKRKHLHPESWEELVKSTLEKIHNNPVEYLGKDLPHDSLMMDILGEIQVEFFKEMKSFYNQKLEKKEV